MTRRVQLLVQLWPWVLALGVLFPVLAPGFVLSYDMVFVPDLALRADLLGLGSGLPRAVPSDALVAVLDEIVPGMLLQKVLLLAALVLAGIGARRLVPGGGAVAQLAATSLYVWNPYVAERLVIGHWPLLLAYAALPWVVDAARRYRTGAGGLAPLVLWLALGATSAAGGVMTVVAALAFGVGRGGQAVRRGAGLVLGAAAVNAPWVVAGLVHPAGGVSDPGGVVAFAARGEGLLPVLPTVLGLGGIWNAEVVPVTRTGAAGVAWTILVLAVCAVGVRAWLARQRRRDILGQMLCAAAALLVALAGAWLPDVMGWLVSTVPGAGLFRDGARLLGLLAVVEASLFGTGAAVLAGLLDDRLGRIALAAGTVLLPLALMPDLAAGAAGRLDPVHYPDEYAVARSALEEAADARAGDVLVLPFTSYRAPAWNEGRRVLDPLGRYLTPGYLASDDLYVSGELVQGEDLRARRVAEALSGSSAADPAEVLAAAGVQWVVVDRAAAEAVAAAAPADPALVAPTLPLARAEVLHAGERLTVLELAAPARPAEADTVRVLAVAAAWLALLGAVAASIGNVTKRTLAEARERRTKL